MENKLLCWSMGQHDLTSALPFSSRPSHHSPLWAQYLCSVPPACLADKGPLHMLCPLPGIFFPFPPSPLLNPVHPSDPNSTSSPPSGSLGPWMSLVLWQPPGRAAIKLQGMQSLQVLAGTRLSIRNEPTTSQAVLSQWLSTGEVLGPSHFCPMHDSKMEPSLAQSPWLGWPRFGHICNMVRGSTCLFLLLPHFAFIGVRSARWSEDFPCPILPPSLLIFHRRCPPLNFFHS